MILAARGKQRLTNPARPAWLPFPNGWPTGWYERFIACLREDPAAGKILTDFMPTCDFFMVSAFAMACVHDSKYYERGRKPHLKNLAADLRKEERWLSSEIEAFKIPEAWTPGKDEPFTIEQFLKSDFYRALCENETKRQRLEHITTMLKNMPRAANTKRSGIRENLHLLFAIREYLQRKSGGVIVRGEDLAAIIGAAYDALGVADPVDPKGADLIRKLKRFERNNPEFCTLIHQETGIPANSW